MNDLFLNKVKVEADVYNVPRARQVTIDFIQAAIDNYSVSSILEIGSGNGFSSISFSQCKSIKQIYTFEIDPARITLCKNNFKYYENIHFFPYDFMKFHENMKFDMIFIDGMKRLYRDFFEYSQNFAHENTIYISDNLNFKDHVNSDIIHKKHKTIIKNIKKYIEYLKDNKEFHTDFFLDVGDGIAITRKKQG